MRLPGSRVAWLMILVAFAALNFGAIRAWLNLRTSHVIGPDGRAVSYINNTFDLLGYGGLPMANILVVGLVIGRSRPKMRPFLSGFEVFGAMALVIFVASVALYTEEKIQPGILWVLRSLPRSLYALNPVVRTCIFYSVSATLAVLPQVAFALIGGLISRYQLSGKARS